VTARRGPLLGLVAVAVVAGVVLAVLATRSSGSHKAGSNRDQPPSPAAATTVPEPVVPVGAPVVSTVPAAPPSSAPGPVTTLPAAGPALTGAGAVLGPPPTALLRAAPTAGCGDLADPGWTVTACGTAGAAPLTLTWVVETQPAGAVLGHRVTVWRPATAGQYEAALVAADDQGTLWSDVRAAVAPISAAGGQQLLVGFHVIATKALSWDLVDSPGRVVVHRSAAAGAAVASPGQLDAWTASPAAANAAPAYVHEVIRNTDGVWRLVLVTRAPGAPPGSQV
jgi:hypothetical protein